MKFVLFVEGDTEAKCLPEFIGRWINPKLKSPVAIKTANLKGYANFIKDAPAKAVKYLEAPDAKEIISVVGLLDLYGPNYPKNIDSVDKKITWQKNFLFQEIPKKHRDRYIQSFAVHELEAWLLSHPEIFSNAIRGQIEKRCSKPETVDFDEPPKKLLKRLYSTRLKRNYKEIVNGAELFKKLDPEIVYHKCPRFMDLMDQLFAKAKAAGL